MFVVQKNKGEYITSALERLESLVQGYASRGKKGRVFKNLAEYKIVAASESMALCVKKNCASGNLQRPDELLKTSDDATAGWDWG